MYLFSHARTHRLLHTSPAELSAREQAGLSAHLTGCPECRDYAMFLKTLQPALTRAMHTRWDSRRPTTTSSRVIEQRWKEKKMKRQTVKLITVAAGLGLVVVLFLYGPGLLFSLLSRFNFSPGTSIVRFIPLPATPTATAT